MPQHLIMKTHINKLFTITWLFLVTAVFPAQSLAQDELIIEIYRQSVFYPESLDDFVNKNKKRFDDTFYECLHTLQSKYLLLSQQHLSSCEGSKVYGQVYSDCVKENPSAQTYLWLSDIEKVLNGSTKWQSTTTGASVTYGKSMMNTMLPGFWEQIQEPALSLIRQSLSCK